MMPGSNTQMRLVETAANYIAITDILSSVFTTDWKCREPYTPAFDVIAGRSDWNWDT